MSNSSDDFVAVVAILVIFGLPLAYAISSRFFAHQERLAMIQRGIVPPQDARWQRGQQQPYAAPQAGGYDPYSYTQWQADRALRKGITVAMVGFALLVGLSFINPWRPGPWLLGGLIPLFVGIAQVISAVLSGARIAPRFGGPAGPPPGIGQQPGAQQYQTPPNFAGSRDVPPGPYAWRPGATTELEKPVRPPDVKQ